MCTVSVWRSRNFSNRESLHGGDFALIFLNRPSAYQASVTLNWDSAILPVNNQLTVIGWGDTISGKGSDNPANLFMQAIRIFNHFKNVKTLIRFHPTIGMTWFVLLVKPRFQVQMHAKLTRDFFKVHLQVMMFCIESHVLVKAHVLATFQV